MIETARETTFVDDERQRLSVIGSVFEALVGGARLSAETCIERLSPALPLLAQLAGTPQDDVLHTEGDTLVHTALTVEALYADFENASLAPEQRATLLLAAVLHDIGKPATTRERHWFGAQRIVAPQHAREGRWYVAPILFASGLPSRIAHTVSQLVGHHALPLELVARDASAGAYWHAARLVDPVLLYWLARANVRGRESSQRGAMIEAVELYRMFASEYGAFETARATRDALRDRLVDTFVGERTRTYDYLAARAARDLESGRIASPEEAIARSYGHLDDPELVILVGPQGSGKSTYARDRLHELEVVTGEARAAREQIRVALRAKGKVVYDASNLTAEVRDRTCKLGFDYNAFVTLIVMASSEAVRHERLNGAAKADEPALQWPEVDEGHCLRVIGPDGKELLRA